MKWKGCWMGEFDEMFACQLEPANLKRAVPKTFDGEFIQPQKQVKQRRHYDINTAAEGALEQVELPEEGSETRIFAQPYQFNAIAAITLIANKAKINRLVCVVYHVGKQDVDQLALLHQDGKLGEVWLFTDTHSIKKGTRAHWDGYEYVERVCGVHGFHCAAVRTHIKVFLFDTDDGKYVMETSGNLNAPLCSEFFVISKSAEVYDWYTRCMQLLKWV